ncbi:MAG TPA: hypothetical protein VLA14_09270 [Polyangia bacterium]|nr:hypothetical protein [Polyangia bacterium]
MDEDARNTPWRTALRLLGAWTLLDLLCNVRFPGREPALWFLLPSLDATALLALVALFAARNRRVPRSLVVLGAVLVTAVRLFRFADGGSRRYFNRPITLGLDLTLWMDGVRLLADTMSHALLALLVPLAFAALFVLGLAAAWALRVAERALAAPAPRALFAGAVALAAVVSLATGLRPAVPGADAGVAPGVYVAGAARDTRRVGGFGDSALPRLAREADFAVHLDRYREAQSARIEATERTLAALPHALDKLGHASVFLFLIESYGAVVVDEPDHARRLAPVYDAATASLEAHGFTVASSLLSSPTYSGRSWLAHTTLTTAVRTTDVVTDRLVQERRPAALAGFFHDAGYRTVIVQPANHYRALPRWLYDFDVVYSGWDFDYRGPTYRWASMPDQYVIDFIHRHEVAAARGPLLVAYTLITSHAPWSDQPPVVADWSRLGDGALFAELPRARFPITWTNLADAADAYDHSIAYDLEVIVDYVDRFVGGDALVIVLGDHQPVAEVTRFSGSSAVPIHVWSRNPAFIAPFVARGYTPGLRPARLEPPRGMETLLPDLLADFSTPASGPEKPHRN